MSILGCKKNSRTFTDKKDGDGYNVCFFLYHADGNVGHVAPIVFLSACFSFPLNLLKEIYANNHDLFKVVLFLYACMYIETSIPYFPKNILK